MIGLLKNTLSICQSGRTSGNTLSSLGAQNRAMGAASQIFTNRGYYTPETQATTQLTHLVSRVTKINSVLTLSIHNQEKRLGELMK